MPRPGGPRPVEKSKDFFGSIKRLIKNLNPWKYIMILALCLGMVSSILALIAPNKLSEFTDTISEGLKVDTKKLETISLKVMNNFTEENIAKKTNMILTNDDISDEDKLAYSNFLSDIKTISDKDKATALFMKLPDSIIIEFLDDFTIDNTVITSEDQLVMVRLFDKSEVTTSMEGLKLIDELPKSVYSLIEPKIDMKKIKNLAIFMGVIYLLSAIFSYIQNYSMTTVSNNFARKLRSNISKKINTLPLKYFDSHETGDILSRITNDIDAIAQNLNNSLATMISSTTLFLGSILMMFITNWVMALTAIVASAIGFMLMFAILNKSQKYFSKNQEVLGKLNGYIEEMYSGHNVVKAYNGSKEAIEKFSKLNDDLYEAKRKSIFLSGLMQPIMGFVGNLGYVAVCTVGALLTMNGYISFGVIVAFMIYIRLFTNPLSQIAQAMTNLQSTAAASERVFEFLDEKEMSSQDKLTKKLDKNKVKGNIEFKNVKFGYNLDRTIINDFSVKATSGQKIAIVGPTGAGKTTMVNLLMKFYEINGGDIIIDGVSTKELTRENIHELFCMVLQDTWLFEGTIRDNIKFNKEDITDEEIWEACRVVGIDHFVKTLSGGLDAKLSDNDSISGGQKQLITIARGMLENAPFLILDEATSNVDTRTEELVQKAMDKLTVGKTSFIIAHRLSTIKNADLILVMQDGNIVEQGTHEQLLSAKGFYATLYNSQFEK